ncbi:hypothetical protein BVRB_8g197350 [Beta vulgaris subsp. vulgaris]|nr:hypothetical protein BVRB_8g197350 [Beta vulgaris subsp. vulgaris]
MRTSNFTTRWQRNLKILPIVNKLYKKANHLSQEP